MLDNYKLVLEGGIVQSIRISVFYSASSILLGLLLGSLCAYGLKRCRFACRRLIFYLVVAGIPLSTGSAALLIPNYLYMSSLNMMDKWYILTLMYTAYNLPMAIWIMMGGLDGIPYEIEEAAAVDGCRRGYIIFRLIPALIRLALSAARHGMRVLLLESYGFLGGMWPHYSTAKTRAASARKSENASISSTCRW